MSYCQSAGLNVQAANGDSGTLGLFIPNTHYVLTDDGTRAAFRLGTPSVSAQDGAASIGTLSAQAKTCPNCDAPMLRRDDGTWKCTRCYFYVE